ncbi:hypothetical protein [Thalassiella azotivora]
MSETSAVPCVRYAGLAAARFEHPEGVCACFHGGPAPVLTDLARLAQPRAVQAEAS